MDDNNNNNNKSNTSKNLAIEFLLSIPKESDELFFIESSKPQSSTSSNAALTSLPWNNDFNEWALNIQDYKKKIIDKKNNNNNNNNNSNYIKSNFPSVENFPLVLDKLIELAEVQDGGMKAKRNSSLKKQSSTGSSPLR